MLLVTMIAVLGNLAPPSLTSQTLLYIGSAQTWRLALIEILQSPFLKALYFRAGDIWLSLPLG